MKKILLVSAILFAGVSNIFGQSAETKQIIDKHIAAIGGESAWKAAKTMVCKASIKAQGAEIKVTTYQINKESMRANIEVMGMKGYTIITNTNGWTFMPWANQTKPEPMTADDVKSAQDQLSFIDEFITYKELDKKLEDLGSDEVDGTDCFKLKLTGKSGNESTFFIDKETYFVIKQLDKTNVNGKDVESTTSYSNYKKLDSGIFFPMSINSDNGPMEFTEVTINDKMEASLFEVKP